MLNIAVLTHDAEMAKKLCHALEAIDAKVYCHVNVNASLDAGFDRCLPASFDEAHLGAVVRALTRRRHGLAWSVSQYGPLRFHHDTKQLYVHGVACELTKREAQVLELLLRRVGQIIDKETFIQEMVPDNLELNSRAVEVYIHRLRKKISNDLLPIRNIKRCGYLLPRFADASEASLSAVVIARRCVRTSLCCG